MLHSTTRSFSSRLRIHRNDANRAKNYLLFCTMSGVVVLALSSCSLLGKNNHETESLRSGMDKRKVFALLGPPRLAFVCLTQFVCEPVPTSGEYPKDSIPSGMSSTLCLSYEATAGAADLVLLGPDDKLSARAIIAYQGPDSEPAVSKADCWMLVSQPMKTGARFSDFVAKKNVWETYSVQEFQRY